MKKKKIIKKKYRLKKKKPLLENNALSALLIFSAVAVFFYYFLLFYPKFQVKQVVVESERSVNEESVANFIITHAEKKSFPASSKSMFFFHNKKMEKKVLSGMPVMKDVTIEKIFPNTIKLAIKERERAGMWCRNENMRACYKIDEEGVAFQRTTQRKNDELVLIKKEAFFSEGDNVFSQEQMNLFYQIKNNIEEQNLSLDYIVFHSTINIDVFLKENWRIQLSLEDIERGLENLDIVYNNLTEEEMIGLEYINLRFGDRIFIK